MLGFAIFLVIVCCLIYIQKETGAVAPVMQIIANFITGCFSITQSIIKGCFNLTKWLILSIPKLTKWLILSIPKLTKLIFLNLHYLLPSCILSLYLFIAFKLGNDFLWITSFKLFCKMSLFALTNNPIAFMFFWVFILLVFIGLKEEIKEKLNR